MLIETLTVTTCKLRGAYPDERPNHHNGLCWEGEMKPLFFVSSLDATSAIIKMEVVRPILVKAAVIKIKLASGPSEAVRQADIRPYGADRLCLFPGNTPDYVSVFVAVGKGDWVQFASSTGTRPIVLVQFQQVEYEPDGQRVAVFRVRHEYSSDWLTVLQD